MKRFSAGVVAVCVMMAAGGVWGSAVRGAEIVVAAGAAEGGKGTAEAPFAALAEAVKAAVAGDVITLGKGEYKFAPPKTAFEKKMVTIRAAKEDAGKVTVTGTQSASGYTRFEGLRIPEAVRVRKAKWVQYVRCTFESDTKSHWGVSFMDSQFCGAYGCTVKTLSSSQMNISGASNIEFRYNDVSNGTSDAFQGAGDNILIEGNYVHDFTPGPGAHPDGIQLGNTTGLTVRGNVFDCKNMQTFFFSWTAKETTYDGFVIENNVCTTARYHGLTTHPSGDMVIRNNLFIPDAAHPDGTAAIDFRAMKGKLTFQNNILWQLGMESREQDVVSNNIYMKKHWKSGTPGKAAVVSTVEDVFVDRGPRDYRLKEKSPARGAGAARSAPETDILGRKRPAETPSIGPIEPQADDKPFMEMWKAHLAKMQAEVRPPDPKE